MGYIVDLGEKEVSGYGVNRILGRIEYVLPWPTGDKKKSLQLLEEAFNETIHEDFGISDYSLNVLYYAESLIYENQKEKAKDILNKLIAIEDYESYNSERIPETKKDQEKAKQILKDQHLL